MTTETYNMLTSILLYSSLCVGATSIAFFIMVIVGWNGPHRRTRLHRFLGFLVLFPALIGTQLYLQWGIFMPLRRKAGEMEMLARRRDQFEASTIASVGDTVPEFAVEDIDGNPFSVDGTSKKVVLINFFTTWCGPCQLELPRIQQIWERYGKNESFSMIVIGREESLQTVSEFRNNHAFTFPLAADPEGYVFSLFAKESIPRVFLISSDGKVLYATRGYDAKELDRLDQLLTDLMQRSPLL